MNVQYVHTNWSFMFKALITPFFGLIAFRERCIKDTETQILLMSQHKNIYIVQLCQGTKATISLVIHSQNYPQHHSNNVYNPHLFTEKHTIKLFF